LEPESVRNRVAQEIRGMAERIGGAESGGAG
jgi:hypothetical protein